MTSRECFKNKWFYMKYIGKYLGEEILLTCECSWKIAHLTLSIGECPSKSPFRKNNGEIRGHSPT